MSPRSWSVLALTVVLLAGCRGSGWADAHLVDGYWIGPEEPCPRADDRHCTENVRAAVDALGPLGDDVAVVSAMTAARPWAYFYPNGDAFLTATAGLAQWSFVVVDLSDGRRRVVPVVCEGPVGTADGREVRPRRCRDTELDEFREGAPPPAPVP